MPTDSTRLAAHLNMPVERRSQAVATEEEPEAASASATDIEDSSSDDASLAASDPADPTVAWCPPIPNAVDDPTEQEIASAADQLDILISQSTTAGNPFCCPANLGVLPHLWLQARLQFTLPAIQEKFSRILVSVAGELWLRGEGATIEAVLPRVARALTVRLAEKLAQALSTLMRLAESMVTPETECLLYATYWFRPILSELLHTAGESAALNKVTDRQPKCVQNVVDVCSGASSLLAWFPASWASKIAPEFLANPTENGRTPQIQELACPKRAGVDDGEQQHKLRAVRFSARDLPFFDLAIDREIRDGNFFAKLIQGSSDNLVEPNMMRGLQPVKPCRTMLEVIIPSRDGLSPEQWKDTATLCPLDWPSNYSLLRLWHRHGSLQTCGHKQGIIICSLHGQCTITYLQSESCSAGLRCLKLRLSCKTISEMEYFRIDAFDNDHRHLHMRHIELHLPNCDKVLRRTNKPIQLPLNSRMNGTKQLPLTSGIIGTTNCKVRQVLTHSPPSAPLSSPPFLPKCSRMFHPLLYWDHRCRCFAYTLPNLAHLTKDVSGASVPSDAPYRSPFTVMSTCCRGKHVQHTLKVLRMGTTFFLLSNPKNWPP